MRDPVRAPLLLQDGRLRAAGECSAQCRDTFFEARVELPRVERREVFAQRLAVFAKTFQKGGAAGSQDAADAANGVGF